LSGFRARKASSLILIMLILLSTTIQLVSSYTYSGVGSLPHRTVAESASTPRVENVVSPAYISQTGFNESDLRRVRLGYIYDVETLARELEYDPVKIYHHVRNTFNYEPYYGFLKGPTETLLEKAGNDLDLACLLVALLRESGIPARYVYGTISLPPSKVTNWIGVKRVEEILPVLHGGGIPASTVVEDGNVVAVTMEHVWVEAYVNGRWIPLDPSFKEYQYLEPTRLYESLGLNSTRVIERLLNETVMNGDYVVLPSINEFTLPELNHDFLENLTSRFAEYLVSRGFANISSGDVEGFNRLLDRLMSEVKGGREIIPDLNATLPTELPYEVLAHLDEFSEIPHRFVHELRVECGSLNVTLPTSEIAGKRLTISFVPATEEDLRLREEIDLEKGPISNINVTLILSLDGRVIAFGDTVSMGTSLNVTVSTLLGNEIRESETCRVVAGGYYSFNVDLQRVPSSLVKLRRNRMNITKELIRRGMEGEIPPEEFIGESLNLLGLIYWNRLDEYADLLANHLGIVWVRYPSVLQVGTDFKVRYENGVPISMEVTGIFLNLLFDLMNPHSIIGDREAEIYFMMNTGVKGSQLEYYLIEIIYGMPAISTYHVFLLSAEQGIPIYNINSSNVEDILPTLAINETDKEEIRYAVEHNLTVLVPARNVVFNGWNGTGYYIFDPETGSTAYTITGGIHGGKSLTEWIKTGLETLVSGLTKALGEAHKWSKKIPIIGRAINIVDSVIQGAIDVYYSNPCDFWATVSKALINVGFTTLEGGVAALYEAEGGIVISTLAEAGAGELISRFSGFIKDKLINYLGLNKITQCVEPEIEILPKSLERDLGEIKRGETAILRFLIRNRPWYNPAYKAGNILPLVYTVRAWDKWLEVTPKAGSIRRKQEIVCTIDTRKIERWQIHEGGYVSTFISIESNDKYEPLILFKVKFRLVEETKVSCDSTVSIRYKEGGSDSDYIKIRVSGVYPFNYTVIPRSVSSLNLRVSPTKGTNLNPGKHYIRVSSSGLKAGTYHTTLTVKIDFIDEHGKPKSTVRTVSVNIIVKKPEEKKPDSDPDEEGQIGPGGDHPDETFDVSSSFIETKSTIYALIAMAVRKGLPYAESLQTLARCFKQITLIRNLSANMSLYMNLTGETSASYTEIMFNADEVIDTMKKAPDVVLLGRGFPNGARMMLSDLNEPVYEIPDREVLGGGWSPTELARYHPIMVIPSGGLFGANSPIFRSKLRTYVESGGVVIAFAQQYGEDYEVLPGQPSGFGWLQDQMCSYDSIYIDVKHPVFSSQWRVVLSEPVDGYFTTYPEGTITLLRRTKNDFPAMIMYKIGEGYVIATTMYSDWAYEKGGSTGSGKSLVRDLIAWAKYRDAPIHEFGRFAEVRLLINVTNTSFEVARKVGIALTNPYGEIAKRLVFNVTINPGETGQLNVTLKEEGWSYSTPGIWRADAILIGENGRILKTIYGVAVYSLSNYREYPDSFNYHGGAKYQLWVTVPSERVLYGSNVTFTIHIKNNDDQDLADYKIGIGGHEEGDEGGEWWRYYGELTNITVPAHSYRAFNWTLYGIKYSTSVYFALFEPDKKTDTYFLEGSIIRVQKGVWLSYPYIRMEAILDKEEYRSGENATLTVIVENLNVESFTWNITLTASILNGSIYTGQTIMVMNKSVVLPPSSTIEVEFKFTMPTLGPQPYSIRVTATTEGRPIIHVWRYDSWTKRYYVSRRPEEAWCTFRRIRPEVEVSYAINPVIRDGNATITFNITVVNNVTLRDPVLELNVYYPNGQYGTYSFNVPFHESSAILNPSFPLYDLVGTYRVDYSLIERGEWEYYVCSGSTSFRRGLAVSSVEFSKSRYRIREPLKFNLTLLSLSPFNDEAMNVTVEIPDIGYVASWIIRIDGGEEKRIPIEAIIPAETGVGRHGIYLVTSLGENFERVYVGSFYISESWIVAGVETEARSFSAGGNVTFYIENVGGVDTRVNYSIQLYEGWGTQNLKLKVYKSNVTVLAGGRVLTNITIPSDAHRGVYTVVINGTNLRTNRPFRYTDRISIRGIALQLTLDRTEFNAGENITIYVTNVGGADAIINFTAKLTPTYSRWIQYSKSEAYMINFTRGSTWQMSLNIPFDLGSGAYHVWVIAVGEYDYVSAYIEINVTGLELELEVERLTYNSGEDIIVQISNIGGVNANVTVTASISRVGFYYSWPSGSIALHRGDSGTVRFTIPVWVESGTYTLDLYVANNVTDRVMHRYYTINVTGLELEVNLEKTSYNAGESILLRVKNVGGIGANLSISSNLDWRYDLGCVTGFVEAGEERIFEIRIPVTVPTGDYKFTATIREINTGKVQSFSDEVSVLGFEIRVELNKYTFTAGENVTVIVENVGGTLINATVTFTLNGFSDTGEAMIQPGETADLNFTIPETIINGTYTVTVNVQDRTTGYAPTFSFDISISGLALEVELERLTYNTGENVTVIIRNVGAVNATCTYQMQLIGLDGRIFNEKNGTVTILAGEDKEVTLKVPEGLMTGTYRFRTFLNETATGLPYTLEEDLTIHGVSATIHLSTLKSEYFTDENVTVRLNITSLGEELTNATAILRLYYAGEAGWRQYYSIRSIGYVYPDGEYVWALATSVLVRYSLLTEELKVYPIPGEFWFEPGMTPPVSASRRYIWVGADGALLRFDKSLESWYVYDSETTSGVLPSSCWITALTSTESAVYIGIMAWEESKDGLYMLNLTTNEWTIYNSTNSGLPNNLIYSLCVNGSDLWIGTYNGLARKSGEEWTVWTTEDGLGSNLIYSLAVSGGNVWVTHGWDEEGVSWMDSSGVWRNFHTKNSGLISNNTRGIFIDGEDVWITYSSWELETPSITIFNMQSQTWTTHTAEDPEPYRSFADISYMTSTEDKLWLGFNRYGIGIYDKGTGELKKIYEGPASGYIRSISVEDGRVWVYHGWPSPGLSVMDIATEEWRYIPLNIEWPNVMLAEDGYVWIGTYNGLYKYDVARNSLTLYTTENSSLPDDDVRALALLGDWLLIGTWGGLCKYSPAEDRWETIREDIVVMDIAVSQDGLWLATYYNGVLHYNLETGEWTAYTTEDGLKSDSVMSITVLDGEVWVSYEWYASGVTRIDLETGEMTHYDVENSGLAKDAVMKVRGYGSTVWFCYGWEGGGVTVFNLDNGEWRTYTVEDGLTNNEVYDLCFRDNVLWLATGQGVTRFSMGLVTPILTAEIPVTSFLITESIEPTNAAGEFLLTVSLVSQLGQLISTDRTTFKAYERNVALTIRTDRDYYKAGMEAQISGEVTNYAPIPSEGTLTIKSGSDVIYALNITLQPGETYRYGLNVTITNTTIFSAEFPGAYAEKEVIVVEPTAEIDVTAPTVVGRRPFNVTVRIRNTCPVPIDINLEVDGRTRRIRLDINASAIITEEFTISNDTVITISVTGDITWSREIEVIQGEKAEIRFYPEEIYPEGLISIPYNVTNTGLLDTTFNITITVNGQSMVEEVYVPVNETIQRFITLTLLEGNYTLSYNSTMGSGSLRFQVWRRVRLSASALIKDLGLGRMNITITVRNMAPFNFSGMLTWSTGFYQAETAVNIPAFSENRTVFTFTVPNIPPGDYNLTLTITKDGKPVLTSSFPFTIHEPEFKVELYPLKESYDLGEVIIAKFNVTNVGMVAGVATLNVEVPGEYEGAKSAVLLPNETVTFVFNITLPDDLVEGKLRLIYSINGFVNETYFRFNGFKVSVDVKTDKVLYEPGENATLIFNITNLRGFSVPNASIVIQFNGYEETKYFNLTAYGSTIINFTVPVTEEGRKLFYSIYVVKHSGRSLYIDSIYLHTAGKDVRIWSDKERYMIGENVTIYVNSTIKGLMTLTFLNYTETINITSTATTFSATFKIPEVASGTYLIEASILDVIITYRIDIIGYSARIVNVAFNKESYIPGETVKATITIDANRDFKGYLKVWVYCPRGVLLTYFNKMEVNFTAGENKIEMPLTMEPTMPGAYRLILGVYYGENTTLTVGVRHINIQGSVVDSVSLDKIAYYENEEMTITVSAYGTSKSNITIYCGADILLTETVEISGFTTFNYKFPVSRLNSTTITAELATGAMKSSKSIIFSVLNKPPIAEAGADIITVAGREITLNGSLSTDPGEDPLNFTWYLGDGTIATGMIVTHTYMEPGNYTVTLKVTDVDGAFNIDTLKVTVLPETIMKEAVQIKPEAGVKRQFKVRFPIVLEGVKAFIIVNDVDVSKLAIRFEEVKRDVYVMFKRYTEVPEEVPEITNLIARRYISILVQAGNETITEDTISNMTIWFQIEKEWVASSETDRDHIEMLRYTGEAWVSIPVELIGENETHFFYRAESPSLSYYAIAAQDIVAPKITIIAPPPNETIEETKPVINATISDMGLGVDPSTITMKIDGETVEPTFNPETGLISYIPEEDLSKGKHVISISVRDKAGNLATINWSFNVQVAAPPPALPSWMWMAMVIVACVAIAAAIVAIKRRPKVIIKK